MIQYLQDYRLAAATCCRQAAKEISFSKAMFHSNKLCMASNRRHFNGVLLDVAVALQVSPKRHNVPGMKERGRGRGRGPPRGRGFFPRGRGRGGFYPGYDPGYGYGPYGGGGYG